MAKDIKQLPKDLEKIFDQVFDKEMLQVVAKWIRDTIYKRTKSGKGLNKVNRAIGGATNKELKAFSPKSAQQYIDLRARSILGPFGTPTKSNLTFTGELLESIQASVVNNQVRVEIPSLKHGSGISMQKLLDFVEEARPFFGLSDTEKKTLDSMISRMLREKIRKLNKK